MSPYGMFYRKLYSLVQRRLNLICLRLFGSDSNSIEMIIWNLFLFLFEKYTKILFQSRHLDQILLSTIYYSINSNIFQQNHSTTLTWFRLIQAYKTIPNTKLKTLRSVFIRVFDQQQSFQSNQSHSSLFVSKCYCNHFISIDDHPPLTPSKPAGTIHLIDGKIFGDIASFYSEVFLNIENLDENVKKHFEENSMIQLPSLDKYSNNSAIHCGQNLFIHYSANQLNNYSFNKSNNQSNDSNQSQQNNSTNNILSSSIQAGLSSQFFFICLYLMFS